MPPLEPPEPPEPLPPETPPCCAVVSSWREAPGSFAGVQVVVVPSALTVRTPGVSVAFPLAPGLYAPLRSGIAMGCPVLIGSLFTAPSVFTVPLSAPPTLTAIEGLTEPAGMSAGLSMTDLPNLTVRS